MYVDSKSKNQAGFSLLELLISMGVMIVIVGATMAIISGSLKFSHSVFYVTDAEESLRSAHELINRDLTSAGDGLKSIGTITVPLAFATNWLTRTAVVDSSDPNHHRTGLVTSDDSIPLNTAVPSSSPAATFLENTDRISMLIQDKDFALNSGGSVSLLPGKITVVGTVTNLLVGPTNIGLFQTGEIYAILAQNSAAFGTVTGVNTTTNTVSMANGDTFGLNQTGTTAPLTAVSGIVSGASTQNVAIIRLQIIQYYVTSTGMMMRRVFGVGGAGFTETPIAEHVTNLQFRYMTNLSDANGFVQQPVRVINSTLQQSSIREVETTIECETVRAVNKVTNANANTSANGKQKISITTATSVRNLQFSNNAQRY
jgi:type II secretory pathway pseudopilin PulG